MNEPLLHAIPDDIEALLRCERPVPSVPADVAGALWSRVARSTGIGGFAGSTLIALLLIGATALGGGLWLLDGATSSERAALGAKQSAPTPTSTPSATSATHELGAHPQNAIRTPASAPSESWPAWFGQRDVAWRVIAGRVIVDGRPAPGVDVVLRSVATHPAEHTRTDDDGMFAYAPHPAWSYVLSASLDGSGVAFDEVNLRDPSQDSAHRLLAITPCAGHTTGRVLDDAGNPIAGASLQIDKGGLGGASSTSDASGIYDVCVPGQDAGLTVSASGSGTQHVDLSVNGTPLDIVLHAAATLTGTTRDTDGVPLPDVQVNLWPADGQNGSTHLSARSDAEGRYRVDGIEPGTYGVNAWGSEHVVSHHIDFTAQRGVTADLDVSMEKVYELRGSVLAGGVALAGQWVSASAGELQSLQAISQLDGTFVLSGVPEGTVELSVRGRRVLDPQSVDVHPDVPLTLRIEVAP